VTVSADGEITPAPLDPVDRPTPGADAVLDRPGPTGSPAVLDPCPPEAHGWLTHLVEHAKFVQTPNITLAVDGG
jgi:hypothetical protein